VRARDEASGQAQQAEIRLQAAGGPQGKRQALAATETPGQYRPVAGSESTGGSTP